MSTLTFDQGEPERFGEFALWVTAALVVFALHLGIATAYLLLRPEPEMRAEAPAFDVAFMPASPARAAPESPPDEPPRVEQSKVEPPKEAPPMPPPEPPALETTVPEPIAPPVALVIPEPPTAVLTPEAVVVAPPPKPADVAPPLEKPVVVPPPPPQKPLRDEKAEKRPPPKAAAPAPAKPMRVASAPNPGAESEGAKAGRASWLSEFVAHMRRFKTSVNGSKESGTVVVSATIDRNGRLVSRRVASSSGSAVLDRAALELVDHAQPFPKFPAGMTQAQLVENIPLHLKPQ